MLKNLSNTTEFKTRYWRVPIELWGKISEKIVNPNAIPLLYEIIEKYEIGESTWNLAFKFQMISLEKNLGDGPHLDMFLNSCGKLTSKFQTDKAIYAKSTDLTITMIPKIFKPYICKELKD